MADCANVCDPDIYEARCVFEMLVCVNATKCKLISHILVLLKTSCPVCRLHFSWINMDMICEKMFWVQRWMSVLNGLRHRININFLVWLVYSWGSALFWLSKGNTHSHWKLWKRDGTLTTGEQIQRPYSWQSELVLAQLPFQFGSPFTKSLRGGTCQPVCCPPPHTLYSAGGLARCVSSFQCSWNTDAIYVAFHQTLRPVTLIIM